MRTKSFLLSAAVAALSFSVVASAEAMIHPMHGELSPGLFITKDDPAASEKMLETLHVELGNVSEMLTTKTTEMENHYKELKGHFDGVKSGNDEIDAKVKKQADEYAALVTDVQTLTQALDQIKKELDQPLFKGGKDLEESDRKAGIELQKRAHLFKGGTEDDFKEDLDNLVIAKDYRSAVKKLAKVGIESRDKIIRSFTEAETKAFEASSLDSAFFMPEMLGLEVNCTIECAELLDLYNSVSVSRSTFMFPQVVDYGAIGQYDCDAKCDAELGPEGNIQYMNGRTFDFRGVFCFQRKVLQEANYDLLGFMFQSAARSYRINRNQALITGDGINEPLGWLSGDCFTKIATPSLQFNHQIWRRFLASAPVEYGPVIATMHQNVFAYLASMVDNNGRFIYGDGLMSYSPDDVRERIRISNCLPDATAGGTRGSAAAPFVAGDFLAAAGNWKMAYSVVNKKPMFMEQFEGGSTAWCVKYQFGAEDGGFVMCCPAARTLVVGA